MNKPTALITTLLVTLPFLQAPLAYAETPVTTNANPIANIATAEVGSLHFTDVPEGSRYSRAVPFVAEAGYMKGFADGSFHLNENVTRLEVVSAIMRALKPESLKTKIDPTQAIVFRDVKKTHAAYPALAAAEDEDVLDGLSLKKNYFKPSSAVNTGEALHLMNNALNRDADSAQIELKYEIMSSFPDGWQYVNDVRLAVAENALMQKSDKTLFADPTQNLTRGDFAVLLYRFTQTRTQGSAFGMASWYGDGLSKVKVEGSRGKELRAKYLTAANRTLPIGTLLKVTNEMNGKSVEVVVNDRGPYIPGRIVDLSKSAFAAIEIPGAGTAVVKIEIIKDQE